jgi:hypothetical protein
MKQKPDQPDRLTLWHILAGFGWGILVCLLITLLAGCKTIKYVPVETVKTEYVTKTDTLIQKDTIAVPYPVEKPLTTWQRFCLDYGKVTTGATIALILLLALRIFRNGKK